MTLFVDLGCLMLIWAAILIQKNKPTDIDNLTSFRWLAQGILVGAAFIIQKSVGWGDYAAAWAN